MLCLQKTIWNNIKPARSVRLWHLDSQKKEETTNKKRKFSFKKRTKGTEDRTAIAEESDP
jgi:hypothetical protein